MMATSRDFPGSYPLTAGHVSSNRRLCKVRVSHSRIRVTPRPGNSTGRAHGVAAFLITCRPVRRFPARSGPCVLTSRSAGRSEGPDTSSFVSIQGVRGAGWPMRPAGWLVLDDVVRMRGLSWCPVRLMCMAVPQSNAVLSRLRAELAAALDHGRRLKLRVAELERRLGMDSSNSGAPTSKEPA